MKWVHRAAVILLAVCAIGSIREAAIQPAARAGTTIRQVETFNSDTITYYLLDRGELASLLDTQAESDGGAGYTALRVAPQSVIAVISSDMGEAALRRTIDDANKQTAAYGEPGFRLVDLRPSDSDLAIWRSEPEAN
jgi:hypothetical protein